MNIQVFQSKEALYEEVSKVYIDRINQNPNLTLGLATGTTPIPLYQKLIQAYQAKLISFKGVKTFNLDEYIGLDESHPETYFNFMRRELFNHVDIDLNQTHIPNGRIDLNEAMSNYQSLLQENPIDIQLLGIGSNGHIGFNEPNTAFDSKTHVIELALKTRKDNSRLFNSLDEVPTHAITMGISEIIAAKEIIVIATGKNKSDAVYEMIKGPITESLPASILQKHANVLVFLDAEAACKLT